MSERLLRKEGMLEDSTLSIASYDFPHLSAEELKKLPNLESYRTKATFNLTLLDLKSRLFEEYNGLKSIWECQKEAHDLLQDIPLELMPNIQEWLDNKPLSDIEINGVSINYILEMFKNSYITFIDVLKFFIFWKDVGYQGKKFYLLYFSKC